MNGPRAGGPPERRRGAWIGVAVGVAVAVAVSLGLFGGPQVPAAAKGESGFTTIRADGKLVLRVVAPKLY